MKEESPWRIMFSQLVGDVALFIYRLRNRLPAIRLVPEEYPNDLNRDLPGSAYLLAITEYDTEPVDAKKVRDRPYILFNLFVAGVLRSREEISIYYWREPEKYKEKADIIRAAVANAIEGREFYLTIDRREIENMRQDILKIGLGLYFRKDSKPVGIGLRVRVKGEPIDGMYLAGRYDFRLPWTDLFPKGTPEREYFDKISFWDNFWSRDLPEMVKEGVVVDPRASWRSCRRQIQNCRRVIEDTGDLAHS